MVQACQALVQYIYEALCDILSPVHQFVSVIKNFFSGLLLNLQNLVSLMLWPLMASCSTAVAVACSAIRPFVYLITILAENLKQYCGSILMLGDSVIKWKPAASTIEKTVQVASSSEAMHSAR